MSRFLLDENVSRLLAQPLRDNGHEVKLAVDIGLKSTPDSAVFQMAQDLNLTVVTADLDFASFINFPLTFHSGIVVLRLGRLPPRDQITRALTALLYEIPTDVKGCLMIVDSVKTRIRRA